MYLSTGTHRVSLKEFDKRSVRVLMGVVRCTINVQKSRYLHGMYFGLGGAPL